MDLSRLRPFLTPVWRPFVILAVASAIVWGFVAGSGERAQEATREAPVSALSHVTVVNGETVLTLDAAEQKAAAIDVVAIRNTSLAVPVRAYGAAVDPQALSDLHNSYVNAKAQLGMAEAKLQQSQLTYKRSERLLAAQADSVASRDAAFAQYRVDQATVSAARTALQTSAANAEQNWGATLGMAIIDGDAAFTRIVARQDVLVQVSLPPGAVLAHAPLSAVIQLEDGTRLDASYLSDAPKADPHVQGTSYFYVVPAAPGLLPNMNVSVALSSTQTVTAAPVPSSAIVWWQGAPWVYQRTASTQFVRRSASDVLAGSGHFTIAGLPDGAQIVVRGAQMLLSEEFRPQTPTTGEDDE